MEPFKKEKCFGLLVQKINFGKHRTARRCLPTFPALSGATKKSSIYPPPLWLVGQLYGAPHTRREGMHLLDYHPTPPYAAEV
jgi:hypothetical protein